MGERQDAMAEYKPVGMDSAETAERPIAALLDK